MILFKLIPKNISSKQYFTNITKIIIVEVFAVCVNKVCLDELLLLGVLQFLNLTSTDSSHAKWDYCISGKKLLNLANSELSSTHYLNKPLLYYFPFGMRE